MTLREYRPDVDGLRGVAVLSVVLFHAFPEKFASGFIGVDIFFVLSGFLITSIIVSQLSSGKFTFSEFYRRRVLRIFPPLVLILGFVLAAGYFLLLSTEFMQLGKHVASAAGFLSNFTLLRESGYFDNASETKPLLHLWSLAIEEQFYIFYPLTLWIAWKLKANLRWIVGLMALLSFAVNIGYLDQPEFGFYFPLARFWELMIGAFTALIQLPGNKQAGDAPRDGARSMFGVICLGVGFYFISPKSLFPGYWALLPTVGSALVVSARSSSFVNRVVFSHPMLVWVGKISYSLYLWHWVLFSLARVIEGASANTYFRFVLILLSFLLAALSTFLIEMPLRFRQWKYPVEWMLIGGLVLCGGAGLGVYYQSGLPWRDSNIERVIKTGESGEESYNQFLKSNFYPCLPESLRRQATQYGETFRCFQSQDRATIDVAILGDSHADHIFPGLARAMKNQNVVFYSKTAAPLANHPEFQKIYSEVLSHSNIKKVILNAYWNTKPFEFHEMSLSVQKLLEAGKEVFFFDDVPDFVFDPSRCKSVRRLRSESKCTRSRAEYEDRKREIWDVMKRLKDEYPQVVLVYSSKYFCNERECSMSLGDRLVYRDPNHVNIEGSDFLALQILKDYPQLAK